MTESTAPEVFPIKNSSLTKSKHQKVRQNRAHKSLGNWNKIGNQARTMSDSTVIGMVGSSSLTTTHHDGVSILIKVNDIKNHMVALSTERYEFRSHHTLYELKGILCDWVFCSKRFRT